MCSCALAAARRAFKKTELEKVGFVDFFDDRVLIHTPTCYFPSVRYISTMAKRVNRADFVARIKAKKIALFSARDVQALFGVSKVAATFLLYRYAKRGVITRMKRGLYAFSDALPPDAYLANKLYSPSYLSREFALSYHGVIPETVYEITSVTPKATRKFEVAGKIYSYKRVKKPAFTGYLLEKQRGFTFRIADAEKAFVDTLYYRVLFNKQPMSRFNREKISRDKALQYAGLFGNQKLVAILTRMLRREHHGRHRVV